METIEDAPTGERTVTLNDPTDAVDIKFKTVVYETVQVGINLQLYVEN